MLITECKGPRHQHPVVRTIVVDDSKFILSHLNSLLQCCLRISVIATAENGRQALDLVRLHQPELVLMDLQMPEMNGFEAASHISREFPSTQVVHVTTNNGPDVERASLESGAQFLLPKAQFVTRFCEIFQQLFHDCDLPSVAPIQVPLIQQSQIEG